MCMMGPRWIRVMYEANRHKVRGARKGGSMTLWRDTGSGE